MVKYIVKRILLSIVILLGVSLIIYTLVRMMPVDYLETKYSTQLAQGTITQEQVDQFKKDSGLYMPDGFLQIKINDEGAEYDGKVFTRDIQSVKYEQTEGKSEDLYAGNYYTKDGRWQLTLQSRGENDPVVRYNIYQVTDNQTAAVNGTFEATADASGIKLTLSGLDGKLEFTPSDNDTTRGYLEFTVNSGDYSGQVLRKEVTVSDYNKVIAGQMDVNKLIRGDYDTHDESYRITLDKKGNFTLYEMEGKRTSIMTGNYEFNQDSRQIILRGVDGAETTYSTATLGEKIQAVLGGYFSWLWNMMQGNLGRSFTYEKAVTTVIGEHMWISFIISFIALVFEFAIAIPLGITSATHQYSAIDYTVTVITMIGISFPSFFFAAMLIKLFSSTLGWFPSSGLVSGGSSATGFVRFADMSWHMVLPMVVMVVLSVGSLMRYTRTNMLEVLNSDYIRTARAKGLSEKKVIYVHAFRNTLIPLMTLMAGILPSLFGGAMITEEVFSIDGIGRVAYKSLTQGDIPLIMGYNMFLAVLTVIGTLLSDIMYAVVDPRVKLTK